MRYSFSTCVHNLGGRIKNCDYGQIVPFPSVKRWLNKAENVSGTIAAYCIVLNICIKNGRPDPDTDDGDNDDDSDDDFVYGEASVKADAVRDLLNLSTKDSLLLEFDWCQFFMCRR